MAFWRRHYLSIDPRTLGFLRIALATLLLADLAKRSSILSLFYTNTGLIPNHRVLWRPIRESMLSFLLSLSAQHEVTLAFALIAVVYLSFLVGYRTRLMHVLSWLCLVSLEVRVDLLSNGADFVFSDLVLWTVFLPLGRRFSLDAVLNSLRSAGDRDLEALRLLAESPRDARPVVSLAVLAATLQLSVIYIFNAIHKTGPTWRDGSAVYWLVHQERIVTSLGVLLREHVPLFGFQLLTYSTLVIEAAIPLLILSPWGRPWTRRLAILAIFALHGGIALLSNLGLFSPVMMVYGLLLIEPADWQALQTRAARKRRRLRLYIEESTGLCWQMARLWVRLDLYQRIEVLPLAALEPARRAELHPHGGFAVQSAAGDSTWVFEPAFRELLRVLPTGPALALFARWARPITADGVRWLALHRTELSEYFGLAGAAALDSRHAPGSARVRESGAPFQRRLRSWLGAVRELGVVVLMVVAISQVLVENTAIPNVLKHRQPLFIRRAVDYFRLNQGWSMFAPDAPTQDMWIVIDAETVDGRHVDPFNALASRVADPSLRTMPARLGQSAAYCDYTVRIAGEGIFHEPLRDWIMTYHRRTHRAGDRILHFKAYTVEQDSPAPGETEPRNVQARVFLSE
jgi:hypothetical protein